MLEKSKRRERIEEKWLLTFSDLITLLLTFFVMVLCLSRVGSGQLQEVSSSLRNAFGGAAPNRHILDVSFVRAFRDGDIEDYRNKTRALQEAELLRAAAKLPAIRARVTDEGVAFDLAENMLFARGRGEIEDGEHSALLALSNILKRTTAPVRVESHTDDAPSGGAHPSNWELSSARAISIVRYLVERGGITPARLSAMGWGDAKPLVPGNTETDRARNRRVTLVVTFHEW